MRRLRGVLAEPLGGRAAFAVATVGTVALQLVASRVQAVTAARRALTVRTG